jgi:hypothetical protein
MNISMILIGGGVLIGALTLLPKGGDKEAEEDAFEFAPFYPGPEVDPDFYPGIEVVPYYPEPVDTGMPMGDPERRLTTIGNVEVTVGVR